MGADVLRDQRLVARQCHGLVLQGTEGVQGLGQGMGVAVRGLVCVRASVRRPQWGKQVEHVAQLAGATAQAVAECLRRQHVGKVTADRTLPLIFADHLRQAGIAVEYDPQLGVMGRRAKDPQEVEWLRAAQKATEDATKKQVDDFKRLFGDAPAADAPKATTAPAAPTDTPAAAS